jgi:HK97 family phage prohead protease
MRFYAPLAKVDAEQQMVWGYASTEAEDDQGEIITRDALAAALGEYMKFANIREMHQMSAVGVAEEAGVDQKGLYLGARIVDPRAWDKVKAGVYKGFSVGGRVKSRDSGDHNVITGLSLTEISLVDRPANPEAIFDCWKADGASPTGEGAARRESASGDHTAQRDGDFADPGYQSDRRKRYPLHSEPHIRAAWAYIHRPRNAAKYTPDQVDRIKARIVAAWKEKIDSAGPPLAEGKVAAAESLRKGLGDIGRLAAIILDLDWLQEQLAGEAAMERDDSPQPARLQALIGELCDLLNDLVAEETTELTDGAGASDPVAPQELVAMAAEVAGPALADLLRKSRHRQQGRDVAEAGALAKALADNAALRKTVAEIVPRLDRLAQRVEELAETPLPPLTVARGAASLSKREDGGGGPTGDVVAALARMSDEERTLALIKASYANPIVPPGYASVTPTRDGPNR